MAINPSGPRKVAKRAKPSRLSVYLANPALRSRLPDSALPSDLLAKRKYNRAQNAPATPGSSYTKGQLDKLLAGLVQSQFGGQQQALNQRQQEIPAWFNAYKNTLATLRGQQQGAAQQQVQSLQGMAQTAAGDTGLPPGADPAAVARAQAAAQMRSAGVQNQAALAQNLGGLQGNFLSNLGALSQGQQQQAAQDLFTKRQQLAADEGTFKTTQRQQILSDEADAKLKAALTQAQTGQYDATTAKTKADTQKTQAEIDFFNKHGYYPSAGKPKAPSNPVNSYGYTASEWKKLTAKQRQDAMVDFKQRVSTATTKPKAAKSGYLGQTQQNSYKNAFKAAIAVAQNRKALGEDRRTAGQLLLTGRAGQTVTDPKTGQTITAPGIKAIPQNVLTAALDAVYDGHLSSATVKALHRDGIQVGALGVPTRYSQ